MSLTPIEESYIDQFGVDFYASHKNAITELHDLCSTYGAPLVADAFEQAVGSDTFHNIRKDAVRQEGIEYEQFYHDYDMVTPEKKTVYSILFRSFSHNKQKVEELCEKIFQTVMSRKEALPWHHRAALKRDVKIFLPPHTFSKYNSRMFDWLFAKVVSVDIEKANSTVNDSLFLGENEGVSENPIFGAEPFRRMCTIREDDVGPFSRSTLDELESDYTHETSSLAANYGSDEEKDPSLDIKKSKSCSIQ